MDSNTSIANSSTLLATVTRTALTALNTSLGDSWSDWDGGDIISNGTTVIPDPEDIGEGSYILNTLLGLIIVLFASLLNALGLNLTKLDHVRQQSIPKQERRKEWMRLLWLAGMGTYIASQVFGSPLALKYLRPDWVAPLGSSSLVFNFLFARWLVGTPVTATDIRGTAVIVLGVILILIFSSINHGLSQSISIRALDTFWTRGSWLAYFVFLILFTAATYFVSNLLHSLVSSRGSFSPLPSPTLELPTSRPKASHPVIAFFARWWKVWKSVQKVILTRMEKMFQRADDARITWLEGIGWAVAGGSLAGLCLVFTKATVKIVVLPGHPLLHASSLLTLLLVIFTAVLQIVCLNRALKCADTVVVVPLFYAGYTVFGFINSLIFYDQAGQYARWVLVATFISIAVLISGVVLLSLKSSSNTASDPYTVTTQPNASMRLRPQHARTTSMSEGKGGSSKLDDEDDEEPVKPDDGTQDVLWEVGSLSDASDAEEKERRGVGGGKTSKGERRGLLVDEEEVEEGDRAGSSKREGEKEGDPFGDDQGFGEYEGVGQEDLPPETEDKK